MRARIIVLFLFCGFFISRYDGYAQKNQSLELSKIPQERMYIHYNTSLLFVGEYLYYKAYVLNENATQLSNLSKVAYVELVNKDMQPIFRHKLFLENSSGQSDFFIPSDVPSGHYKLVGYTQLMRNGNKENFFQGDVSIINPYQNAQSEVLAKDSLGTVSGVAQNDSYKSTLQKEYNDPFLELILEKTKYGNRTKVMFKLNQKDGHAMGGIYSMSVRKVDTIDIPPKLSTKSFTRVKNHESSLPHKSNNELILPELRGELISGQVLAKEKDASEEGVNVAISIPEEEGFQLKVVSTDANGNFIANIDKKYTAKKAHVQVLGDSRSQYSVALNGTPPLDYPKLEFNGVAITPAMEKMIVERSIHNQIENGYFVIKPDSLLPLPERIPFKKEIMTIYDLDDYTRFSTIRETLVEVVDQVWTKRVDENRSLFQILPYQYDYQMTNFKPLVLMDGIPVQDHTQLSGYNARDVQSVSFIRGKYVIGPKIFQGVLNFETIDRDYAPYYLEDHSLVVDLVPPEPHKRYYQQKYDETHGIADQLLDFRYQLLWEPNLKIEEEKGNVTFYTSDLNGTFEIVIEGFTKKGKPIYARKIFTVE